MRMGYMIIFYNISMYYLSMVVLQTLRLKRLPERCIAGIDVCAWDMMLFLSKIIYDAHRFQ